MPINTPNFLSVHEQDEFHRIDCSVMRVAFNVHNTFGRLLDERFYQNELARRCRDSGFTVHREVHVSINIRDFTKPYYLDLLIDNGIIYEIKRVSKLTATHERQLLHYLLLTGQHHGKLINFGTPSVESRFVSTSFTPDERKAFSFDRSHWRILGPRSRELEEIIYQLLTDWGACLELSLYEEGIIHLLGGPKRILRTIDIRCNGSHAGTYQMPHLGDTVAFHLSAVSHHFNDYQKHLLRLLRHTDLDAIQWINFNRTNITLKSLRK